MSGWVAGKFAAGDVSAVSDASVSVSGEAVSVRQAATGAVLVECTLAELSLSSRLGNTARYLTFPDGAQFETTDNDGVDHLFSGESGRSGILHLLESHTLLVAIAALVVPVFLIWLIAYVVPAAADMAASSLPQEMVDEIGRGSLKFLDKTFLSPSTLKPKTQRRIHSALYGLMSRHDAVAKLHFRSGDPNALALPDGSIIIMDDLVKLLSVDEIRAIVYHELGHIKRRHTLRQILQGSAISMLFFLVTGDVGQFDLLAAVPVFLVDLSYSRDFEVEADRYALDAMVQDGLDVTYLRSALQKLDAWYSTQSDTESEGSVLDYLSSHPATEERFALVDEYLKR